MIPLVRALLVAYVSAPVTATMLYALTHTYAYRRLPMSLVLAADDDAGLRAMPADDRGAAGCAVVLAKDGDEELCAGHIHHPDVFTRGAALDAYARRDGGGRAPTKPSPQPHPNRYMSS